MGDVWLIIFIGAMFCPWLFLTEGKTRKRWVIAMIGFFVWLGGMEAYCRFFTDEKKTLSQLFYMVEDWKAWLITISIFVAWNSLLLHLNWKRIKKLWEKKT